MSELDLYLGLKTAIVDSVSDIAKRERVVLLIDQLDALASLMDQNTNRLSVVLHLVHRLKMLPNVHLLISCREFDFRYDSRFSSLAADKVHLAEPSWEAVQSLLAAKAIVTVKWPAEMRELMRNPQHMNTFVRNFASDSTPHVFETYQAMLEVMFTKRVVNEYASPTVGACEKIAAEMSNAEELWIPRISLDQQYPREVDRLIAAGMLQESGRKIGFRHQTLFDYVRTRAFCTGADSLSAHVLPRQDAIFVRSTVWASLHAIRSSSFERYCTEMKTLWEEPTLRRHLRLLLISFLGQVSEPDHREAQWLLPTLDKPLLRGKTLVAVVGNSGWFNKLQSRLPALMTDSDEVTTWQVTMLLQAALAFDRQTVFRLMSRYWSEPTRDMLVLQTIRDLSQWDDQATVAAEAVLKRQSINPYFIVHIAQRAAKSGSGLGARIVATALEAALKRGVEQINSAPADASAEEDGLDAAMRRLMNQRKELEPIRGLIDTPEWHGLEEVASIDPAAFIHVIWPWLLQIATILADRENPRVVRYRSATGIELRDDIGDHESHIPHALKIAMGLYAENDPDSFLKFTTEQRSSELIVAHRLMAFGLERLARVRPIAVLEYLTGDSRRMALGGYDDQHRETKLLISAVASQLTAAELEPLERIALSSKIYLDQPGDDPKTRWERRRWNREHRLRLLRAFPADCLSIDTRKLRDEEEIALPTTRDYDTRIEGGIIGSPVSAQQMKKAANKEILNLFGELRDNTGTSHPRHSLEGGVYQASQEFAVFAKEQPSRAIAIIESLEPRTQEYPAAYALHALSEVQNVDAHVVVDLIQRLDDRGFSSQDFRVWTAWALQKLAVRCEGLGDRICEMLKSWLAPATSDESNESEEKHRSEQPSSLLWSSGRLMTLPQGNHPVLVALSLGYRCRKPPELDRWLEILCGHLDLAEHLDVWRALVCDFDVLRSVSDRTKAVEFLDRLFHSYPNVLTCFEGTLFLARSHRWLPAEFVRQYLLMLEESTWSLKEQAIGEISMLRKATVPTDEYCGSVVDRAVALPADEPSTDLRRVGIAFTCVHLWREPEFRQSSHEVLVQLARNADGHLPGVIMDLFRVSANMAPDERTKEILSILVEAPDLIHRGGPSFLADRLKELLSDGFDAQMVAEVTRTILVVGGSAVGDIRTKWAGKAGDLIEIAVTLQRMKNTRSNGLDLFETLMDAGAYEADQVLRDLDRRII